MKRKWNLLEEIKVESVNEPVPDNKHNEEFDLLFAPEIMSETEETKHKEEQRKERYDNSQIESPGFYPNPTDITYPKTREKKTELPTTGDPNITSLITDPSTNITKHILGERTPFRIEESKPTIKPSLEETKKTPSDQVGESTSTLKVVSSLSSHSSLGKSQGFDSKRVLQNLKDKYKGKNSSGNSCPSSESPQIKIAEHTFHKELQPNSSDKLNTPVLIQANKTLGRVQRQHSIEVIETAMGTTGGDYKEQMKDFVRIFMDNRLPAHLRSNKSLAQIFKSRFCDRFYDGRTEILDGDVQAVSYYNRLEHATPSSLNDSYLSQIRNSSKNSPSYSI